MRTTSSNPFIGYRENLTGTPGIGTADDVYRNTQQFGSLIRRHSV